MLFVTPWLHEWTVTNTDSITYIWDEKGEFIERNTRIVIIRDWESRQKGRYFSEYKLPAIRQVNFGNLKYHIVILVIDTLL